VQHFQGIVVQYFLGTGRNNNAMASKKVAAMLSILPVVRDSVFSV